MCAARRTTRPPQVSEAKSATAIGAAATVAQDTLKRQYCLCVPLRFLIVVEGTIDKAYLETATALFKEQFDFDLMSLDDCNGESYERITVCTPINPMDPERKRGGLPWVTRLAEDLRSAVLRYEVVGPICFVLDHDSEGQKTEQELRNKGYTVDRARVITLKPDKHPNACRLTGKGNDPIVVEDLLSMRLQCEFFESTTPSCEVAYDQGSIVRISWRTESKALLCEHVCKNANGTT